MTEFEFNIYQEDGDKSQPGDPWFVELTTPSKTGDYTRSFDIARCKNKSDAQLVLDALTVAKTSAPHLIDLWENNAHGHE